MLDNEEFFLGVRIELMEKSTVMEEWKIMVGSSARGEDRTGGLCLNTVKKQFYSIRQGSKQMSWFSQAMANMEI